jgi:hypothetical protein
MDSNIITALIAFAGSAVGTLGGILATQKLTQFRLEQLEKKVDKHNNVIERVFKLEANEKSVNDKIEHLESFHQQ